MKKIVFLSVCIICLLFAGCSTTDKKMQKDEIPEESPVCPEGFYRIDSVKQCIILEDDFSD